ncbi:alpha/beta-hydrolase [Mycena galopus ATCC 62051]|nr:alpha/beta-hydrolase [Mycena galopus ATCC 62051]
MAGTIRSEAVRGPIPLVIVQGFLGYNGAWMWGDFEHYLNLNTESESPRRTIFVSVGPVSSLHDRACELYYALLGGTVDYGLEHSNAHKHARYGRRISQGQYPEWSPTRPLHFLAHSIGGPTLIKLQSLIKEGHFGPSATTRMIFSINAISAPFRGTQAVYLLGERVDAAPAVRQLSVGSILGKWVHILSYLSPILPQGIDFHGDCRSLTYRDISFLSLLKQLWKSDWAESRDATPFDVTFQASEKREADGEGVVDPETYYQSHVAVMTRRHSKTLKIHTPALSHIASPLMYISAYFCGKFDYSTLRPSPEFLHQQDDSDYVAGSKFNMGEEYWANDGVVPIFSQWHPLPCRRGHCKHFRLHCQQPDDPPKPGIWYVNQEEDVHHMSLVPLWTGTDRQKQWWKRLGRWLSVVEGNR